MHRQEAQVEVASPLNSPLEVWRLEVAGGYSRASLELSQPSYRHNSRHSSNLPVLTTNRLLEFGGLPTVGNGCAFTKTPERNRRFEPPLARL